MEQQNLMALDLVRDLYNRTYSRRHIHKINDGDFQNVYRFIKNGTVKMVSEDTYFVYDDTDSAFRQENVIINFTDTTKKARKTIEKMIALNVISETSNEGAKYCFNYNVFLGHLVGSDKYYTGRYISKTDVPYNADGVKIRYFTASKGGEEYFPNENKTPSPVNSSLPKKYIYKIDFGEYGVYIGQTENIRKRMNGHKNSAKKETHCYILNELYRADKDYFQKCLDNVQILNEFSTYAHPSDVTNLEYQYQVECLRNGEKLLGKQCWDEKFRNYLSYYVDEYEYQELLYKSFKVNGSPYMGGYSTYNEHAKINGVHMRYEDVVRHFDSLREARNNS